MPFPRFLRIPRTVLDLTNSGKTRFFVIVTLLVFTFLHLSTSTIEHSARVLSAWKPNIVEYQPLQTSLPEGYEDFQAPEIAEDLSIPPPDEAEVEDDSELPLQSLALPEIALEEQIHVPLFQDEARETSTLPAPTQSASSSVQKSGKAKAVKEPYPVVVLDPRRPVLITATDDSHFCMLST